MPSNSAKQNKLVENNYLFPRLTDNFQTAKMKVTFIRI